MVILVEGPRPFGSGSRRLIEESFDKHRARLEGKGKVVWGDGFGFQRVYGTGDRVQGGLTRRRRYARALGRAQRGAVTVEAALITPLICLIVFGAVEFGFYFKEAHTTSSAATRGARELSALPKQPGYQGRVATLISNALSVLNGDDLSSAQVVIYKADTRTAANGNVGDGTLPVGISDISKVFKDCATQCWHFTWDGTAKKLVPKAGESDGSSGGPASPNAWTTAMQWACAPDSTVPGGESGRLDTAGVWIKVHYTPLTPLFGWLERDVISHAVFVLEPYPDSTNCVGTGTAPPPNN